MRLQKGTEGEDVCTVVKAMLGLGDAQPVKWLVQKYKELSSIPSTHVKSQPWSHVFVIQALGMQTPVDSRGSLANYSSLITRQASGSGKRESFSNE